MKKDSDTDNKHFKEVTDLNNQIFELKKEMCEITLTNKKQENKIIS